jgi:hypothetical protein
MFEIGQVYTAGEIAAKLGGSPMPCLPTVNNKVVCGRFIREINPEAPDVILIGDGPKMLKNAKRLCEQKEAIPVFLKKSANDTGFRYIGYYKGKDWSDDPRKIADHPRGMGAKTAMRLFLTSV